jgi:PhnB protein
MAVQPIPVGYHTVTPYLIVESASELIDFLQAAFNAQGVQQMTGADGRIVHAEVKIGDSIVMVSDASDEWRAMPSTLHLFVTDTDAMYQAALQAGATSLMEPADQFYGDRSAGVEDSCGNRWWLATHIEDVSPDELAKRMEAYAEQQAHG